MLRPVKVKANALLGKGLPSAAAPHDSSHVLGRLAASTAHPLVDYRHESAHMKGHDEWAVLVSHVEPVEDGGYNVLEHARIYPVELERT